MCFGGGISKWRKHDGKVGTIFFGGKGSQKTQAPKPPLGIEVAPLKTSTPAPYVDIPALRRGRVNERMRVLPPRRSTRSDGELERVGGARRRGGVF